MDCNSVREQLDGRPNDAMAAHLRECVACRAEAAFRTRLAAAITALPRAAAPDALMARVMADVHKPSPWVLPAWEMVGLAAACLLLVLVPMALGLVAWSPGAALAPEAIADWIGSVRMTADLLMTRVTAWADTTSAFRIPHDHPAGGAPFRSSSSGVSLMAGVAAAAFALALALLLSWRGNGMALGEEGARA